MKFKKIFLIYCFLLIFLVMGSAYSSQDINCTDADEPTLTSIHEEAISEESDDFNCSVAGINVGEEYEDFVRMEFTKDYDVKGNITVIIDDEVYFDCPMKDKLRNITDFYYDIFYEKYDGNFDYIAFIDVCELKQPVSYGNHTLAIKNTWDGGERLLVNTTLKTYFTFYLISPYLNYGGDKGTIYVRLPEDADGTLTLQFNGKVRKVDYNDGKAFLEISYKDLKLGKNDIVAKLTNDSKYPDTTDSTVCDVVPQILPGTLISSYFIINNEEKAYVTINVDKSMGGTLKLFNTVEKDEYDEYEHSYYTVYSKGSKLLSSVKVVDGVGKLTINKFKPGNYHLYLEYKYKNYEYAQVCHLIVVKNNPKISVSFNTKSIYEGEKVKATIKSPKCNEWMGYMIDGEKVDNDISLKNGKVSKTFSKLKPGTHKIRFYIYEDKIQYSKVFTIKVKSKISLNAKNVVFKKSSKKFTLKATLKIKGKVAKYKKVSFKLKGKTYKVKTNKKGIAKITLKKSKLNKIKVGQKIKFQVSYGKKTVGKYIKIKK